MSDHKPLSPPGRFGPFSEPSRIVCVICGDPIGCEAPSLVGPPIPASADDWAKADAGRAYTAKVQVAHERCAYPEGDDRG